MQCVLRSHGLPIADPRASHPKVCAFMSALLWHCTCSQHWKLCILQGFATMERVLEGIHKIAVADMVAEASVRKHIRELFMKYAVLSTGISCRHETHIGYQSAIHTYTSSKHRHGFSCAALVWPKASFVFLDANSWPIHPTGTSQYEAVLVHICCQCLLPAWPS